MKLVRYGDDTREQLGALDADGRLRDLSGTLNDLPATGLSPEVLFALTELDLSALPIVEGNPRLGPPISGVRQIIGVGLNYKAHAAEAGLDVPSEPLYFMKAMSALSGPNDPIIVPPGAVQVDWEGELGVVIGTYCSHVKEAEAMNYIAGYVTANDVSEREYQLTRGTQWTKGKSCPSFAPIGPWLVTKDEIVDPHNLDLTVTVNGEVQQSASTSDMIFPVPELVSWLSRYFALLPGDIILTGTPAGVGFSQSPQRFLKVGDKVSVEISGLGRQEQTVIASAS